MTVQGFARMANTGKSISPVSCPDSAWHCKLSGRCSKRFPEILAVLTSSAYRRVHRGSRFSPMSSSHRQPSLPTKAFCRHVADRSPKVQMPTKCLIERLAYDLKLPFHSRTQQRTGRVSTEIHSCHKLGNQACGLRHVKGVFADLKRQHREAPVFARSSR